MVKFLYDQNVIIYTFAGLCVLGFIIRLIVNILYKLMVKESDNLGATKNKALKHMKMKFETCYKLKIGVNNVDTFVDKNILRYRFCGILLSTWENVGGQVLFINLLLVPILAVFGVIYDCGQDVIMFTGAVGISASSILILVDKSMNLSAKKRAVKLNLMDYLENFLKVRLEQETFHPEQLEQYRREYFQAVEANRQISASADKAKEEPKDELNRRREARQKKEAEKRVQAIKREEEQKKIEEARKEEEKKRLEDKKQLAAKRRQEELQKLEEEREALEARRAEVKKKAEERQLVLERRQQQTAEKDRLLHSLEEDLKTPEEKNDIKSMLHGVEEIAAEKERAEKERAERDRVEKEKDHLQKLAPAKSKSRGVSVQEEKLIEDVLKEFFA